MAERERILLESLQQKKTSTENVVNEKKRQLSVPAMQNTSSRVVEKICSASSSKVEVKEKSTTQAKTQVKDNIMKPLSPITLVEAGNDDGNDRVTVDRKPNKPLIPGRKSNNKNLISGDARVENRPTVPPKSIVPSTTSTTKKTNIRPTMAEGAINRPNTTNIESSSSNPASSKKTTATNIPSSVASSKSQVTSAPNSDIEESMISLGDEEVRRQRAPLTEKYNPYISHSDTCLGDARRRLQVALDQTRQLRAAFTERVYGKYRVCLQPPPQTKDIIKTIEDDPNGMHRKLQIELKRITDEKNAEKRELQRINTNEVIASQSPYTVSASANIPIGSNASTVASMAAPNSKAHVATNSATSNTDNAEQYLYVSSGLSLIVLPEDDITEIDMSMYRDRAPINAKTSQRVRGISAAAASSGKLMLQRARQGKVARADRKKRLQQKISHQAHYFFDSNYYSKSPQFNQIGAAVTATAKLIPPMVKNASSIMQKTKQKVAPSRSRGSQKVGEGKKRRWFQTNSCT